MATLELRRQRAKDLDIQKRKLESIMAAKIARVFRNMADDASNLYKATSSVQADNLAENYSPEFLKEIRDAMRRSIAQFGFNLRKSIEKKYGLFFDAVRKEGFIDMQLKQILQIDDEDLDPKLESINNEFLIESTMFVANESENQNDFVTETNEKMLSNAVAAGIAAYAALVSRQQDELDKLVSKLPNASPKDRSKLIRQIDRVNRQIEASNANQRAIVAENIKTNLLERTPARSELISSQNIGLAESWARQTEAQLIDDAALVSAQGQPISVVKSWQAILDSRTRPEHVEADNQEVGVNDSFTVAGESLKYPRDPNGSAGNTINCRCVSDFEAQTAQTRSHDINLHLKAIEDIDLKPTEEMAKVAKRALEWRKEFNRGGTAVGVARARDIANRKNLSPSTVRRMVSFFARHEVDKRAEGFNRGEAGFPSNGRIAWDLWGGNPGQSWAKKKWEQIKRERDN
jgi:hypothetical protein